MKAYLCGAINGCTDEECNEWRAAFKAMWHGETIDPMRRDYRGRETESFRQIVELDKIDVSKSDVIIVGYNKPSVGTSMEVLYAWQLGKPVVLICHSDAVLSPWLRYHSHAIVHSFEAAAAAAQELLA